MPEWLLGLRRDLGFALRQLRRAPIFAAGVVLSLGFGIGSSATVFSWIRSMLLQPLPGVREAGRLATLRPELRNGFGVSLDEYREWRDQAHSFRGVAASSFGLFAIDAGNRGSGGGIPLYGIFASGNYFDVLGVAIHRGRGFTAPDDQEGAEPVAVLGYAAWQRHFDGDSAIVGRTVRVNSRPVRIIGVAPPRFIGTISVARFDLWVPLSTRPYFIPGEAELWERRDFRWLDVIGRLAPGAGRELADEELRRIARTQAERFEENRGRGARVIPLDIGTVQRLEPQLIALAVVTLLVVLLICSNVATLLLTRAAARERELAVRLALGAGRRRLALQLLAESGLLAVIGAGLGIAMAANGESLLQPLMPVTSVGFVVHAELDLVFLGFVVAVTAGCVLAFGLPPALHAARTVPAETLKQGGRTGSARGGRLRSALVVAQFAFALSILVGATLFLRRDRAVHALDLGYRGGEQVLLAQTEMSLAGYADPVRWGRAMESAAERIAALPGVRGVALGSFVPLSIMGYARQSVEVPGQPVEPGNADRVIVNGVDPGYFELLGIRLLSGRSFSAHDTPDQPPVVVVNQAFSERYFEGGSAVGRKFRLGPTDVTVVGLAPTGRYDYREIDNASMPLVYYAWKQSPSDLVTLHVRTSGRPLELFPAVQREIQAVDPAITLLPATTLRDAASVPFAVSRAALAVLSVLGSAALLLATMGLFSVVSYGASLRTRELGIRMALGATAPGIIALVLSQALRLVAIGTAVGIVAALGLTAALRQGIAHLPDARVTEFLLPALVLGASAVAAGLIPARRAAAVDPARTLRTE